MRTGLRLCMVCLLLLLSLMPVGNVLAQGDTTTPEPTATPVPKTPLPIPLAPVVTLNSDIDDNGVETGTFTITSPNTTQFANAETVDFLAVNPSTRGEAEESLQPANAGTITVDAEDLEYADGHIISFSLVQVAALDDEDYVNSPRLIFCYPVHESCQDPETIVRALPPPVGATVELVPAAQTDHDDSTFQVTVPLPGDVITQAQSIDWNAENNRNGNTANGQQNLGGSGDAQAQAVDPSETIQFGANLLEFEADDSLRITLRSVAEPGSRRYVDSHPVAYYYCIDPNVDCAGLWATAPPGSGNGGGNGGNGGTGIDGTCLNTDEAAPIKVCVNTGGTSYTLYGIYQDSTTISLSIVSSVGTLYDANTAANDNLASGTNTAANKAYTVSYDGAGVMTLSTYYADKGPDVDKPYIITLNTENTVTYVQW